MYFSFPSDHDRREQKAKERDRQKGHSDERLAYFTILSILASREKCYYV